MNARDLRELSAMWRSARTAARERPRLAFRLAREPGAVLAELGFDLSETQREALASAAAR